MNLVMSTTCRQFLPIDQHYSGDAGEHCSRARQDHQWCDVGSVWWAW